MKEKWKERFLFLFFFLKARNEKIENTKEHENAPVLSKYLLADFHSQLTDFVPQQK